ncbi:MAG TPA: DUF3568 family protein [Smithella sp.]|nr:DUF3568 family protein [Smithella sp.]HRS97286.1 DUF3568 family protein [Smithella sp.]
MNRSIKIFFLTAFAALFLTGCNAAVNFNGKVAGISSGRFLYQDGHLTSNYAEDLDSVWKACEKTVSDLKASGVQKARKIASGTIEATIEDEKVTIKVEYVEKNVTAVSVLVGMVGNHMASRLIHEKILHHLKTP